MPPASRIVYNEQMLAWLARRPVRWVLMALAVPVAVWCADRLADGLEARRGASRLTGALRLPGRWQRRELDLFG